MRAELSDSLDNINVVSIGEVAAAARAAVADLSPSSLDAVEDALDEAATAWGHATEASSDPCS